MLRKFHKITTLLHLKSKGQEEELTPDSAFFNGKERDQIWEALWAVNFNPDGSNELDNLPDDFKLKWLDNLERALHALTEGQQGNSTLEKILAKLKRDDFKLYGQVSESANEPIIVDLLAGDRPFGEVLEVNLKRVQDEFKKVFAPFMKAHEQKIKIASEWRGHLFVVAKSTNEGKNDKSAKAGKAADRQESKEEPTVLKHPAVEIISSLNSYINTFPSPFNENVQVSDLQRYKEFKENREKIRELLLDLEKYKHMSPADKAKNAENKASSIAKLNPHLENMRNQCLELAELFSGASFNAATFEIPQQQKAIGEYALVFGGVTADLKKWANFLALAQQPNQPIQIDDIYEKIQSILNDLRIQVALRLEESYRKLLLIDSALRAYNSYENKPTTWFTSTTPNTFIDTLSENLKKAIIVIKTTLIVSLSNAKNFKTVTNSAQEALAIFQKESPAILTVEYNQHTLKLDEVKAWSIRMELYKSLESIFLDDWVETYHARIPAVGIDDVFKEASNDLIQLKTALLTTLSADMPADISKIKSSIQKLITLVEQVVSASIGNTGSSASASKTNASISVPGSFTFASPSGSKGPG